ncbi:glycosyltransferase family 4 protein [Polaribacter tangerinus]|uniref:glycosyltransferase family 4 protein n=1 Tax=Polaribacter tangerinus TaxID=1920034 RepID=UPI000B4BF58B|nr:glycosyltransferase [Polaribacter tangerinus]
MNKVLIIGPFPNPISGVSLANKVVKEILEHSGEFNTSIVNTSYPFFEDSVGSFSVRKLLFFLRLNLEIFKIFKSSIVYITPGQTFFGITKYSLFILLSSILKKELIIHVHGNFLGTQYKQLTGLKKKIFYFLVSKFTKGIVLSNSLKHNLSPFLESSKIFVVSNFAQDFLFESKKDLDTTKLKIIFLSNLMEEKGILFLLDALKDLEDKNILFEAKIAGNIDKSLEEIIFRKIKNLRSSSYVGVVHDKDKRNLLEWSNIFVLPTFYKMEGQPISIIEALATQNVIISTSHAGIIDIIEDGLNGYIVVPKSTNSILEKLLYLDQNKHIIKDISLHNKHYFANNYTVAIFKKKILHVLNANTRVK